MATKDHYLVLGVSRQEPFSAIRDAYQELAKQYHPDADRPDAVAKCHDIQQAYEDLSDPKKRTMYNHDLDNNQIIEESRPEPITYPARPRPEFRTPEPLSLLHEFRNIHPSFESLSERFARNFTKKQIPKGERIEPLNVDLVLSTEELLQGGTVAVAVPVSSACPRCYGTGHEWLFPCENCAGLGVVETENTIFVRIPPLRFKMSVIEVSLDRLGIQNLFLRLNTRAWRPE